MLVIVACSDILLAGARQDLHVTEFQDNCAEPKPDVCSTSMLLKTIQEDIQLLAFQTLMQFVSATVCPDKDQHRGLPQPFPKSFPRQASSSNNVQMREETELVLSRRHLPYRK